MKKIFLLAVLALSFICASATRIVYGNDIVISQPVNEDLYVTGGTVTINAAVRGDLTVAGGIIIINDTVTNDILLAGGRVTFNGFVGYNIRCAGGNMRVSRNVTGDVVATGGTVEIERGVTIGGLLVAGGDITVDGNVNGEIRGVFGQLFLNGAVAKNIDCRGGNITINGNIAGTSVLAADNIAIGDNAVFNGEVRYWAINENVDFKHAVKNSRPVYDPSLRINGEWYYLGAATVLGLLWYLGMALLMIGLLQYLFPVAMQKAAFAAHDNALKSLGSGFLFFIAVPVAAVIAFVTVIGVPAGLLLLFGYICLLMLATVITSVVAANFLNNNYSYRWGYWRKVFAGLSLFILLKLVSLVPFAGWLTLCILICISFGSILFNVKLKRKPALPA